MSTEKIDIHYHQQLSELIDGELSPDQARFLLRRLQHDEELAACAGRWQMLGDALRGNAVAPAPPGFSTRVAAAIAAEAPVSGASRRAGSGRRAMWGGGALAASVAAVAFFIAVPQVPDEAETPGSPVVATRPVAPGAVSPAGAPTRDVGTSAARVTAATTAEPLPAEPSRRSATRSRQAPRTAAMAARDPERAAANASLPVIHSIAVAPEAEGGNPFADVRMDPPAARPWPRAVLPQYSSSAFNAGYQGDGGAREFYPFDPRLPAAPPLTLPAAASGEDQ